MTKAECAARIRACKWAVQASVDGSQPQAAVIGLATSDDLEFVFDTLDSTRKCKNLRANPRIAFVVGWDDEWTLQIEGIADEPRGEELLRVKQIYFAKFPDGRDREKWEGITYFRVRPTWIRFSDFSGVEPRIETIAL